MRHAMIQARMIAAVTARLEALGMSQRTLAQAINMPQTTLNRAMRNVSVLSEEAWCIVCEEIGLDYERISDLSKDPPDYMESLLAEARMGEKFTMCEEKTEVVVVEEMAGAQTDAPAGMTPVEDVQEDDYVIVRAPAEDLYALFCFCEERMADNLRMGTRMPPAQLRKLLNAMYELGDATLRLQPGEIVLPPA